MTAWYYKIFSVGLLAGLLLFSSRATSAQETKLEAADPLGDVARFIDDQTLAVVKIDITKIDVVANLQFSADVFKPSKEELDKALSQSEEMKRKLLMAGVENFFVILNMQDIPEGSPLFVATVKAGGNIDALASFLESAPEFGKFEKVGGMLLRGDPKVVARARQMKGSTRPELATALQAGKEGAAVRLAVALTGDTKRIVREMLPALPPQLGGADPKTLVDGFQWLSVSVEGMPHLAATATLQATDAAAANQLATVLQAGMGLLAQIEEAQKAFPPLEKTLPLLKPEVQGDRLVLEINQENGKLKSLLDTALPAVIGGARTEAQVVRSVNNVRQLMLGMHNYHDVYGHFPAPASTNKAGKPLLSWRVYLLPYVEQQQLYQQFHLNEAWDSEHNKSLIEKMPLIFAAPQQSEEDIKKGLTTYVVPVGEGTTFFGKDGTKIQQITDGTSNTIAILEANPKNAVTWTKPDDIDAGAKDLVSLLYSAKGETFLAAFCDGSVRMLKTAIKPENLKWYLLMGDGHVIEE